MSGGPVVRQSRPAREESDLRIAIANAIHAADCGCGDDYDPDDPECWDQYLRSADATLAIPELRQAWERSQAIDALYPLTNGRVWPGAGPDLRTAGDLADFLRALGSSAEETTP